MRKIEVILILGLVSWIVFTAIVLLIAFTSPAHGNLKYTVYKVTILEDSEYYHSLLSDIRSANKSIYIAIYSMIYYPNASNYADNLIDSLINASKRRVKVVVVLEYKTYNGYVKENIKAFEYLRENGVNVYLGATYLGSPCSGGITLFIRRVNAMSSLLGGYG
jgi:hypothetical protein